MKQNESDRNEFFVDDVPLPHRQQPSRTPAIVGFLLGGAVILTLGFIGNSFQGRDPDDGAIPALRIAAPAPGDTLDNPVALRFTTPAPLRLERNGWVAGDMHLHAMADHREIMPGPNDIAEDGDAFVWRLPPLAPGEHRIYLTWAGRNHANLRGPSDTLVVHIR